MGMIGGLFHVAIKTSDLSQALAFYRDILGLQEAPHPSASEGSLARNSDDAAADPILLREIPPTSLPQLHPQPAAVSTSLLPIGVTIAPQALLNGSMLGSWPAA